MVGCLTLAHLAYEEAGRRGLGAGEPTATSTSPTKPSAAATAFTIGLHVAAVAALVGLGAMGALKMSKK